MATKQCSIDGGYKSASAVLEDKKAKLSDVTLMLLGKTGSGKSSMGNVILSARSGQKQPFEVTDSMCSTLMYNAVVEELFVHGRKVKVVDTPGVMDTHEQDSDEKALDGICNGVSRCSEGVDAFLLVLRLDARLTREEFKAVAKLETLFGNNFWRHVILVFTHGDCVNNSQEKFQEKLQLAAKQIPEFKNLMSKLPVDAAQLFEAREERSLDVADKQIQSLMSAVDRLVAENKTKYTNELFLIAKDEWKKNKITEMEEDKKKAEEELRRLREQVATLEEVSRTDKDRIRELEDQVKNKEGAINEGMKKVTEETRAKKKCNIL